MAETKQCIWTPEPSYTEHDSFIVFNVGCCLPKHCTISKDEIRLATVCPYCGKHITHLAKE